MQSNRDINFPVKFSFLYWLICFLGCRRRESLSGKTALPVLVNTCRGGSVSSFANPSLPSRVRWIFYQPWFPTWCPRKGRSTVRQPLIILCSVFFKISASFSIKGSRGIRKVKILKSNLITSLKSPFFSVRVGLWFGRTF